MEYGDTKGLQAPLAFGFGAEMITVKRRNTPSGRGICAYWYGWQHYRRNICESP